MTICLSLRATIPVLFLFMVSSAGGQAFAAALLPTATPEQGETIDVQGQPLVPVSRSYRTLERVLRRFESFPAEDRAGLTLHMNALLQPGDRPGRLADLMMKPDGVVIPLVHDPDSMLVLPRDARYWADDPPLFARLHRGEHVSVGFFFTVAAKDPSHFTRREAMHWLGQLDRCIEDEGGVVLAFLLPDTHKLMVDVAPGSRFEVVDGQTTHLLVDNQGIAPYRYVFRPADFPKEADFRASMPLGRIAMTLPFSLHGTLSPK